MTRVRKGVGAAPGHDHRGLRTPHSQYLVQLMRHDPGIDAFDRLDAVLFDLLLGVMNSLASWSTAAGDERRGLAWRDAVTRRMAASSTYMPYDELVVDAAAELGLSRQAVSELFARWREMDPWPDSAALSRMALPYAFVTNCSKRLAWVAADRSRASPQFVLSAEEAGCYKPDPRIYHEACRRLGSPPQSTLLVAGSPCDAEGAAAAGLHAVLVARRPDGTTRHSATRVVASLHDVVRSLQPPR
jgi:2-haloacid dehalogenase